MRVANKLRPSEQIALRVPIDLAETLDGFCRERRVKRSAVIIAALRAHLGVRAPAEIGARTS